MPEDFEERVHAALDLLDRTEQAEARVLAEGGVEGDTPPQRTRRMPFSGHPPSVGFQRDSSSTPDRI